MVTAAHVADCLNELNALNPSAQSSLGMMNVTAMDDLTVQIKSERSTHVMDAVLAEWVFVVYLSDASSSTFVFTGPYAVATFVSGDSISLVPNAYYDCQEHRPDITIQKYSGGDALADAVEAGEVDVAFHLPIDRLDDVRSADGVHVKTFFDSFGLCQMFCLS